MYEEDRRAEEVAESITHEEDQCWEDYLKESEHEEEHSSELAVEYDIQQEVDSECADPYADRMSGKNKRANRRKQAAHHKAKLRKKAIVADKSYVKRAEKDTQEGKRTKAFHHGMEKDDYQRAHEMSKDYIRARKAIFEGKSRTSRANKLWKLAGAMHLLTPECSN